MSPSQQLKVVPARTDVIVLATERSVRGDPFLSEAPLRPIVELAFASYAFCLRVPEVEWPGRLTMMQFAEQIEKEYDCSSPRVNILVVDALKSVHRLMAAATD